MTISLPSVNSLCFLNLLMDGCLYKHSRSLWRWQTNATCFCVALCLSFLYPLQKTWHMCMSNTTALFCCLPVGWKQCNTGLSPLACFDNTDNLNLFSLDEHCDGINTTYTGSLFFFHTCMLSTVLLSKNIGFLFLNDPLFPRRTFLTLNSKPMLMVFFCFYGHNRRSLFKIFLNSVQFEWACILHSFSLSKHTW